MLSPEGIEPSTYWLRVSRSIRLRDSAPFTSQVRVISSAQLSGQPSLERLELISESSATRTISGRSVEVSWQTVRAARCQVRIGPFTAQCRSGRSLRRAGAACIRDTFPWFALKHGLVETEFAPSRRLPRGTDGHKKGEGRAGRAWSS
jgi:hypothetical protein